MDNELKKQFIGVFLKGNFVVEDKLVVGGGRYFCGDCVVISLDVHFAGELDFHGYGNDVQVVLVDLDLLLVVRHADRA
jgi:hypothetical protein